MDVKISGQNELTMQTEQRYNSIDVLRTAAREIA